MTKSGRCVSANLVKIGNKSDRIVVREKPASYATTWQCSCGAIESEAIQATSAEDAATLGRKTYEAHCAAAHP
jgi:hypothetical protein